MNGHGGNKVKINSHNIKMHVGRFIIAEDAAQLSELLHIRESEVIQSQPIKTAGEKMLAKDFGMFKKEVL